MATQFSCNPEAASQASQTLAQIAAEMQDGIQLPEDAGAAIGSPPGYDPAAQALSNFYSAASGVHAQVTRLVGGSSRLLGNLAQGTQEVDQDLANELGLAGTPGAGMSAGASAGPASLPAAAGGSGQAMDSVADGVPAGAVPAGAVPVGVGQGSYGGPAEATAQVGGEAEDDPVEAMGEALSQLSQLVPPGATPSPPDHHKKDDATNRG